MRIEQKQWTQSRSWMPETPGTLGNAAQLLLLSGAAAILKEPRLLGQVKETYPNALMI